MDAAELALVIANVVLGIGGAVIVGGMLARSTGESRTHWLLMLVGIYLAESFAVCASMATMVIPIALAFVWIPVFGRWLRDSRKPEPDTSKTATWLAVYSGLPALSLILIPVTAAFCGKSVLSAHDGIRLGIPTFIPWPFCSILGFFGAAAVGAFVLKALITTRGMHSRMVDG